MAQTDNTQNSQDRERGGLDDFTDRFGKLADRMEQAANPDFERQDLPSAEHPDSIKARDAQQAAQSEQPEHDIWPGKTSQPHFERAVSNDNGKAEREGVNSQQVAQDAPEHNLPPPRDSDEQDRATHATRISRDDTRAKRPMTDQYYSRLADRMRDAELDRAASGQDQNRDRDQGHEYSR